MDHRIELLERRVRHLTLAVVATTSFAAGAAMMGFARPPTTPPPWTGPNLAAGAPAGGFVVVPAPDGSYEFIQGFGDAAKARWHNP